MDKQLVENYGGLLYKNGHIDLPARCTRCALSVRPSCPNCGHSLSGYINNDHVTSCEVCEKKYILSGEGVAQMPTEVAHG